MKPVSRALRRMDTSGVSEVSDLADRMGGVIHLDREEPDFPTPPHVVQAAHRAAAEGHTGYTHNAGTSELREALADKIRSRNGVETAPGRITVTPGATAGLYGALLALCDRGDQVLVSDPAWPTYRTIAELQGLEILCYRLRSEDGFLPNPGEIEPLITSSSKVLVLNSPCNPTGAVFDTSNLRPLLELAASRDIWTLSDEVYDEICFDAPVAPSAASLSDRERTVTVWSFSHTYAMSGWRVGYVDAPDAISTMLVKSAQATTACVNTPAQKAALAALTGPQHCVEEMRESYRQRRDAVMAILHEADIPHFVPSGAFYIWVDVSAMGMPSRTFALRLLGEARVAITPGTAFGRGGDGFVRISLATERASLLEGVRRLATACQRWSEGSLVAEA